MPLRSPKMYFCIFGFHRLVWWPKCTPASRSSFIVSVAMLCLLRLASDPERRGPDRAPRSTAGQSGRDRISGSCELAGPVHVVYFAFIRTYSSERSDVHT